MSATLRINNSESMDIPAPSTFWFVSVLLDGKEYNRLARFVGPWNGPGIIIPGGFYQGGIELSEYGIKPSSLAPGEHKLVAQLGDQKSNELTFTVQAAAGKAAAPRLEQVQAPVAPGFGVDRIDPSMLKDKIWIDLKDRLEKSDLKYRWVEVTKDGTCRLSLETTPTSDLAALKGLPLAYLDLSHTAVTDLAPLRQMPLHVLNVSGSQVESLDPLRGMKLTSLEISLTKVKDLSPLADAELSTLVATSTPIVDLSPLRKMPLAYLDIRKTAVKELGPLADLPLATLQLEGCPVTDLSPLRRIPLATLTLTGSNGLDLSQLAGTRLKKLSLSGKEVKDLAPLRGLKLVF